MGCKSSPISRENWMKLKSASGLGVVVLSNCPRISVGKLGVSVMEGVSVMVGESVIVGVKVMVGVIVMVGVCVDVGDGEMNR